MKQDAGKRKIFSIIQYYGAFFQSSWLVLTEIADDLYLMLKFILYFCAFCHNDNGIWYNELSDFPLFCRSRTRDTRPPGRKKRPRRKNPSGARTARKFTESSGRRSGWKIPPDPQSARPRSKAPACKAEKRIASACPCRPGTGRRASGKSGGTR